MDEEEPNSIRSLFSIAERQRKELAGFPNTNNPTYQNALSTTIATYESCLKLSEQVSLFSPNEILDDIASSDIQYLSINYYLANLKQNVQTIDISGRRSNLLRSRSSYEAFVKLLDTYDIISKSDAKLYETYTEDKANFSVASTRDAAARRATKIARFQEEKELKRKLEYIQQNPKLAENDEQVVRDLHLTNIAFQLHQTFAALESLAQELHIISLAPAAPDPSNDPPSEDARQDGRDAEQYSDRLDTQLPGLRYSGPILSADGKPLRPFTLTDNRQVLRKGVFRPDHNLPTMSIDEYLEEERKRGGIIEGGGEQSGIRPEVDEDDLEKADEETMKARAWDEYTEDNPKGSGNTLNRG